MIVLTSTREKVEYRVTTIDTRAVQTPTMSVAARALRLFGILVYAAGLVVLVVGFEPLGISGNSLAFLAWMVFAPLLMQGSARILSRVLSPLARH